MFTAGDFYRPMKGTTSDGKIDKNICALRKKSIRRTFGGFKQKQQQLIWVSNWHR